MQEYLITVHDKSKSKPVLDLLRTLDYIEIKERKPKTNGKRKKTSTGLQRLAGIWKDHDITLDEIRERAWKKRQR